MLKLNFFKQLLWQTTAIVNDDRAFAHNLAALKKTKQNNENIDAAYQKPKAGFAPMPMAHVCSKVLKYY